MEIWKQANIFNLIVHDVTDWFPHKPTDIEHFNLEVDVRLSLEEIRDHQASIAEEHFLKTGEME